jgi:hypothetical protein
MLLNPGQKIGKMRYERIVRHVAPLACRGATSEEIAQTLGISPSMARKDLKACFEIWHERYFDEAERWRPLMVSRYELLFREAVEGWEDSKTAGRSNPKFLDSATQTNIAIGASSSTAAALAPLDVATYAEMLASGSLGELNAVPPVSRQPEVLPA